MLVPIIGLGESLVDDIVEVAAKGDEEEGQPSQTNLLYYFSSTYR